MEEKDKQLPNKQYPIYKYKDTKFKYFNNKNLSQKVFVR